MSESPLLLLCLANAVDNSHHLDANPFSDPATANPFGSHGNESAFSLESVNNSRQPEGGVENIQAYVADHDRRAQELEAKQRELERREAELRQREADVAQYKPNWPPCESSFVGSEDGPI